MSLYDLGKQFVGISWLAGNNLASAGTQVSILPSGKYTKGFSTLDHEEIVTEA
jgi:hypothetical protein